MSRWRTQKGVKIETKKGGAGGGGKEENKKKKEIKKGREWRSVRGGEEKDRGQVTQVSSLKTCTALLWWWGGWCLEGVGEWGVCKWVILHACAGGLCVWDRHLTPVTWRTAVAWRLCSGAGLRSWPPDTREDGTRVTIHFIVFLSRCWQGNRNHPRWFSEKMGPWRSFFS